MNKLIKVVSYFPFYILCITLASIMWEYPIYLSLCYLLMSAYMLYKWHTLSDILYFSLAFLLGPTGEYIAIQHGAWSYTNPFILIPIWLPLAWGIAGLYLKKTTEVLSTNGRENQRNKEKIFT